MTAGAGAAPDQALPLGPAKVRFTGRRHGDMGHGGQYVFEVSAEVEARRRAVVDLPWVWLRQVHGHRVVTAARAGDGAGSRADAAVTAQAGCPLAVLTADCAPVALASEEGVVGAVHAGWAGLAGGVVQRTVEEMVALGARADSIVGLLGPCIRPECYEFGDSDLALVASRLGDGVRSRTTRGRPALDIPAAVRAALGAAGVTTLEDVGACTACSDDYFSWRARRDKERQAMVVWR